MRTSLRYKQHSLPCADPAGVGEAAEGQERPKQEPCSGCAWISSYPTSGVRVWTGRVCTSPEPVTEWLPAHLPAYLSNGLVGMRVGTPPWTHGVTAINGFEGMDTTLDVEAIA